MKRANKTFRKLSSLSITLCLLCVSSSIFALQASNSDAGPSTHSLDSNYHKLSQQYQSVIEPLMLAQSNSRNNSQSASSFRSKSEVMQQVKNRYSGEVIRISLNERTATYSVRVLLPSGKVKSLSVSARK